jgi:hypothetical protein
MKTFLKIRPILLLVIGGLEIIPLLTGGNANEIGQSMLVGMPMLVEAACVLIYLGQNKKEI